MILNRFRARVSRFLLIAITSTSIFIPSIPAIAQQKSCQIEQTERTLFSDGFNNLNQSISSAMKSANLKGEVKKIVWAEGVQIYEFKDGKPKIFAPSADLFSFQSSDNGIYLFDQSEKIGSHYKVGDNPAWEFANQRLVAAEKARRIEGAGEKDAPWLVVKTDKEGYYILRIETRGGIPPEAEKCNFEGLIGVSYQTLYVIVETSNSQASQF